MNQTKLESLIEAIVNQTSGMLLAWIVTIGIVSPIYSLGLNAHTAFGMTMIYTTMSLIRGYVWRRFFNAGLHKAIKRWINS